MYDMDTNNSYTIKEYIEEMDKRHLEKLDLIHDQVKKTNGRVTELEKWKAYITGAVALALAVGIPNILKIL